ncbi:MAG: hypothetical protein PHH71_01460 [Clostridia bacterium]|jgi:hypothetical protein|nr:hypothetical protein [Clostridia bacterium]MDD3232024.1 hypothetical protein [Clostridia bacterium]MDD4408277.1 hypothetical protein [Clostridia bacterium]
MELQTKEDKTTENFRATNQSEIKMSQEKDLSNKLNTAKNSIAANDSKLNDMSDKLDISQNCAQNNSSNHFDSDGCLDVVSLIKEIRNETDRNLATLSDEDILEYFIELDKNAGKFASHLGLKTIGSRRSK